MPKLIINKLGPVETCELECSQFMNFTGFQASERVQLPKQFIILEQLKMISSSLQNRRHWMRHLYME